MVIHAIVEVLYFQVFLQVESHPSVALSCRAEASAAVPRCRVVAESLVVVDDAGFVQVKGVELALHVLQVDG